MLAIRLQRTGRKGHAQYRIIVQEGHRSPNSGKVVKTLGNYNPHTKEIKLDKEQAQTFLSNGAQPSERVARILKANGVKLPSWVKVADQITRTTRNPEKLRKNQPKQAPAAEEKEAEAPAAPAEDAPVDQPEVEAPAADESKPVQEDKPAEESKTEDAPAEETPAAETAKPSEDSDSKTK